jgi:hypothetical protein
VPIALADRQRDIMKYYAYGRVLPERADASVQFHKRTILDVGIITFYCDSSQITMTLDLKEGVQMGPLSAQILCKNHATIVISCLAFTLGCNYVVEMTSVIDENSKSHTFGVQLEELKFDDKDRSEMFSVMYHLTGTDFFLRFALQDYIRAINTETELPFLCYRAIETIKGRFKKQLSESGQKSDDGSAWSLMHSSLGTNRVDIDLVKNSADIIRHGNYYDAAVSTAENRLKYLKITKECILKYKDFLVKDQNIELRNQGNKH